MKLLNDKNGRVPFAVLGVFLLIGSAVTSAVITNLERENVEGISEPLKSTSVSYFVKYAQADMSRALCYSCLEALDQVGETPVTYSILPTRAARDYADENGDGHPDTKIVGDNGIVDTSSECMEFNKNWARNMARVNLNRYLNAVFINNKYQNKGYAINIVDKEGDGAIDDWRDIAFRTIKMNLERPAAYVPLLMSEDSTNYETYFVASIDDLKLEIVNLSSGKKYYESADIECLIPSRLPLLMGLTETYRKSVNGFLSPLMGLTTVISEGYTEFRSLLQYANKYDWVANIVDNSWLQYLTNAGLTAIQYIVFNSVDPLTLVYLAININDLIAKSGVEEELGSYIDEDAGMESLVADQLTSMIDFDFTLDKDAYKTVGSNYGEEAKREVNNIEGSHQEDDISIYELAKDILYKGETTYYYDRIGDEVVNPEPYTEFKGYSFSKGGKEYRLTTKEGDPINEEGKRYGDVYTKSWEDGTDGREEVFRDEVSEEIIDTVRDVYSSSFKTIRERDIDEWYSGDKAGDLGEVGEWQLIEKMCTTGNSLSVGELPSDIPMAHIERWTLKWKRDETWVKEIEYTDAEGKTHYTYNYYYPVHYVEEKVTFCLQPYGFNSDVSSIFSKKQVLGEEPHYEQVNDDNLEHLLSLYVNNNFVGDVANYINSNNPHFIGSLHDIQEVDSESWTNNSDFKVKWLLGVDGSIADALRGVLKLIYDDRNFYNKISGYLHNEGQPAATSLDDVEQQREKLLEKFRQRKDVYIAKDLYMTGDMYDSAGTKAIKLVREWYVNKIENVLMKSNKEEIENEIDDRLDDYNENMKYDSYESAQEQYRGRVSEIGTIKLGNTMKLNGDWTEDIALAISTTPDYFGAVGKTLTGKEYKDIADEEKWDFNVKNICLFGPTGLPILPPTPLTPWIVTINCWYIQVDGHWDTFKVLDSSDETHPDSLFGHRGQMYCRVEKPRVMDRIGYGEEIGECTRLNFGFDTMSLGIVPPGKLPIGDLGNPVETNSVGS